MRGRRVTAWAVARPRMRGAMPHPFVFMTWWLRRKGILDITTYEIRFYTNRVQMRGAILFRSLNYDESYKTKELIYANSVVCQLHWGASIFDKWQSFRSCCRQKRILHVYYWMKEWQKKFPLQQMVFQGLQSRTQTWRSTTATTDLIIIHNTLQIRNETHGKGQCVAQTNTFHTLQNISDSYMTSHLILKHLYPLLLKT